MQNRKQAGLFRLSRVAAQLVAFAVLICGMTTAASAANTLYVSNTPAGGEYGTIQAAVSASSDGDTILIKDGTYTGAGNTNIGAVVHIPDVTIASVNGASKVILDLQGSNPAFYFFNNTSATRIQGLTVENGASSAGVGVIYCDNGVSPVFSQCIFQNNSTSGNRPGPVYAAFTTASPTFTQCQFLNNSAPGGSGGAIYIGEGSVTISQCLFDGNSTDINASSFATGGAIGVAAGSSGPTHVTLINDVFTNNAVHEYGAAIWGQGTSDATSPVIDIENCSFSGNRSTNTNPGTMALAAAVDGINGTWTINNSILYGDNTTGEFGRFLAAVGSYNASIQNSDIQGGYAGTGNINADPLFVTPDLRLSAASPAINAGTVNASSPTVDILGALRDPQLDMGAYEFAFTASPATIGAINLSSTFSGPVATFTDSSGEASPTTAYYALIDWGDGNGTLGTITQPGGVGTPYSIIGSHKYFSAGPKTISVAITAYNPTGASVGSFVSDSATVVDDTATTIAVSAPSSAAAGSPITVGITVKSAAGAQVSYRGTLHFTSSDPLAVLPADASPISGSGTYSVTLKTAGDQTITVTDTANSSLTGTSNTVTVSPLAMTHFSIDLPATATAGSILNLTVTARDQYNNIATGFNGMVILASPTTASISPYAPVTNGTGYGTVTFNTPGSQVVIAVDPSTLAGGVSNSVQVNAGPATQLKVIAHSGARAGSPAMIAVIAQDSLGNTDTTYSGTVHFTSTDPNAVLPADATLTDGTDTFSATFNTAATTTVRARDTVTASITGTVTITVFAGNATHLTITAPSTAAVGTVITATVTAKDALNNTATGYTGTVHLTSTDASAVLPANFTLTSGAKQVSIKLMTPGVQMVTATDTVNSGLTVTTGNITVGTTAAKLVITGPATATAGAPVTFTVTAKDTGNNTVSSYTGTVHLTSTDAQAVLPADATLTNGVGTFTVTLKTATTVSLIAADTVTTSIKGSLGGVLVSSAPASQFVLTVPASTTSGAAFYVAVTAKDAYGNLAKGYSGTVHFTSSDLAAVLPADVTLTNGARQVSIKVKTKPSQTITATDTVNAGITATSGAIAIN